MIDLNRLRDAIRVLGLKRLLRLSRGHRIGWEQTISGFVNTRTMQTLFNVGFFDELQAYSEVDVASFAEREGLDPHILQSLCNSLYAIGTLDREGAGYRLSSKGWLLVEVARGWFDGVYGYEAVFHDLESLLRKEKLYGRDVARDRGFVSKGSAEIEAWVQFPLAVDIVRRNGYRRVLDLGCREAAFLLHLCRETGAIGFGIDIAPDAVVLGEERVKAARLQERIALAVGDLTLPDRFPEHFQKVDALTVFLVLHEILWHGRDAVIDVLEDLRRVFPGVPLIVFEVIRPSDEDMRRRPGMMVQYLLQHELTQQKLVGIEEWHAIFQAAGFSRIDKRYYRFARTAVFILS